MIDEGYRVARAIVSNYLDSWESALVERERGGDIESIATARAAIIVLENVLARMQAVLVAHQDQPVNLSAQQRRTVEGKLL